MNLITDYVMLPKDIENYQDMVSEYHRILTDSDNPFSENLGWRDLPLSFDGKEREKLLGYAEEIKKNSDALIVVGVGGSYMGARAVVEALGSKGHTELYFLGNNLSDLYTESLLSSLSDKEVSLNVVSKSGETIETVIGLSIALDFLKKRYGDKHKERVYITTDSQRGSLRAMALEENYKSLKFPKSVGGRFSVLSCAGLLPMAVAGVDIDSLIEGAKNEREFLKSDKLSENSAYKYAVIRKILLEYGKDIELLVSYEPRLRFFSEWWKQLFAESEGKEGRGLYPSCAFFSTDLHSVGQLIQEGKKNLFETVLFMEDTENKIKVPNINPIFGKLSELSEKSLFDINKAIFQSVLSAHSENGIPNIVLKIPKLSAYHLGELIYFFETAVTMSGLLLKVNPFNQPGVEVYKQKLRKSLFVEGTR